MNILVAVLCLIMGRPYQFYYFVPLVSFWFVVIYAVLAVWPRVTAALVKGENLFTSILCAQLPPAPHQKTISSKGNLLYEVKCLFIRVKDQKPVALGWA